MAAGTSSTGFDLRERLRRLTRAPSDVTNLSGELTALRADVAELRQEINSLPCRRTGDAAQPTAEPAPSPAQRLDPVEDGLSETGQLAERLAVLEDGLDDVGARLEGMARDGISLLTSQLEILAKRVDALANRPALTRDQLEEVLAGLGQRGDGASVSH